MKVSCTMQRKEGKSWKTTATHTDNEYVFQWLASDLKYKYVYKAQFVKRVNRASNYDGTETIIVNYDNGSRRVYVI